jgi:hypothetical protein
VTVDPAYDAAVEIVASWMDEKQPWLAKMKARAACENLAKAGLLHEPRRVAALEAVAEAARAALDVDPTSRTGAEAHIRLEAALDAVPVSGLASGSLTSTGRERASLAGETCPD